MSDFAAARAGRVSIEDTALLADRALRAQEASNDGFMLLRPVRRAPGASGADDLEYRYVNAASERILGRAPGSLVGRFMSDVYPGVGETGVLAGYLDAYRSGDVRLFEFRYTRDGLDNWFRVTAAPADDHLALSFVDVTAAKRAEAEAQEHAALNETLVRTGEALAGAVELETVVQRLTDEATRICRAQFGAFFYTTENEAGDALMLYSLSGAPKGAFEGFPLPRATPIFDVTFRGGTVRLDDVRDDPRFGRGGPQPSGHLPVVSYLAVPVLSRSGAVLGGLFFGHANPGIFTARDERVLVAVAAQAAVAIDNARLYEEATRDRAIEVRRARHAGLHGEVGSVLAAGGDLGPMLQKVTEAIVDRLQAAFARVWSVDASGKILELQASAGMYTSLTGTHARVPVGALKIGWIAGERKPHLSNDVQNDPQVGDRGWAKREGLVAFAGYPLVVADRLIGVVAAFAREPFEPQTVEALRAIADTIALSIERQRADDERERYRAEAQAQRDFLARVFAQAPAAVTVLRGPEHVYEMANPSSLALIGGREVQGRAVRDVLPELAGQGIFEVLDRVYATSERFVGSEVQAQVTRGGELREGYFNFVYEPMRDASGATEGIVAVAVEVTDQVLARKRVEALAEGLAAQQAALGASEERFRSLVSATSQIVWTAAPDGSRTADSPTWRAFTGSSFEGWRGAAWLDTLHPSDRGAAAAEWSRAAAEGDHYRGEFRLRRQDGIYRTMLARGVPVRNDDGSLREWVGTCSDVTDERIAVQHLEFLARSGEALAASLDYDVTLRAAARMVVPALADMCFVDVTENGAELRRVEVVHADPSLGAIARELRQFPPSAHVDHPTARSLVSGQAALVEKVDDELLERVARSPRHLELLREMKIASAIIIPLSTHGQLKGALSMMTTDSSQRTFGAADFAIAREVGRRVSMALDNALLFAAAQSERDRAEQANRAKDEFLAMMSHELRTPLNAVLGWTRMLRAGTLPEEKKTRALETIERNAKAQVQLVDDVLDVSRIVTGKLRLNVVSVNLLQAVETAIETVRPAADAKGIRLHALLDPDAGTIMGDPDRFQQICWNLLTNAVKFTPKGGRVHVRLQREDSYVHLAVEDTGKGVPPEFLPYVFERFRQADASITRVHGGLGLGLAIVKHLVELHGGTIEAHSEGNDKGAQFIVRVPISPLHQVSRAPAVAARPVQPGEAFECPPGVAGLNILVLDDEGDARELLETVLTGCSAHVRTAASVVEALALLRERTFDVIVSDIGLPEQDGYAFIRAVRALGADNGGRTPAVALTAYARAEDRTRALLAGFNSHVAKPVEPMELLVVVANVAGRFGMS